MEDSAVANEKSTGFEDDIGDPELEARLYAEIYFSNESYENNERAQQTVEQTPNPGDQVTTQLSSESPVADLHNFNITSKSLNNKNHPEAGNFFYDYGNQNDPRASDESVQHSGGTRRFPKQQRLLARQDLWLPSKNVATTTSGTPNRITGRTWNAKEQSTNQMCNAASNTPTLTLSRKNNCIPETPSSSKKKKERKKQKKKDRIAETPHVSKKKKQILVNNSRVATPNTSKYSIVSKTVKLNMEEAKFDTLSISSDSDDSILEVPIPPKAQPPLIVLPDSDEDCDRNGSPGKKGGSRSVKRPNKAERQAEKARNAAKVTCEYDEPSTVLPDTDCIDETSEKSMDVRTADSENGETICDEDTDLILNCSQPLAASLHIRGDRNDTIENFSLEGVTEKRTNVCAETHETQDPGTILENRSSCPAALEHRDASDSSTAIPPTCPSIDVGQNDINISRADDNDRQNETTNRKRQKDSESRSSKKNNTSETPEKRRRRDANETSGNDSMTDYFFKPMTNEMQAFYNSPCGSESMNVDDIQSRMPSHPSHWKILHADLVPPARKRGRVCPRCRNDFHHGKRCPEQPSIPSCVMCGVKGHTETRCPQTMCLTCGHKYTTFRQTCCRCAKLSCDICHGVGHNRRNCPDLWRRFHHTTTETLPQPKNLFDTMKEPHELSCCNCGKRGHAVATCQQLRWSQHYPTPTYISSYTEGPFYPGFRRECDGNENELGNIEEVPVPVPLPVHNDCVVTQSTNRRPERDPIFQCGNLGPETPTTFTVVSKRLDVMPNAHLDGLIAGHIMPVFLFVWLNVFAFNTKIQRSSKDGIRLFVQANCQQLAHGVEKILMQWLTRTDLEKVHMKHGKLPCDNFKQAVRHINRKSAILSAATRDPKKISEHIVKLAYILERTSREVIRNPNSLFPSGSKRKNSGKKKKTVIHGLLDSMIHERAALTTALYARSWVAGGEVLVRRFRDLVKYFSTRNDFDSPQEYIDVVYLYNELFTYHESDALTQAWVAATAVASKHAPSSIYSIQTLGSKLPRAVLKNCPYNFNGDNNSEAVFASPLIGSDSVDPCSTLVNNVTTEPTGSDYQENFYELNIPQMSSTSCLPDSLPPPNSGNTLLLNPCRKSKKVRIKKNDKHELLVNVGRVKQKRLRRVAQSSILSARNSNILKLRKMADLVKFKLGDKTVRCSEIQKLRRAVVKSKNIQHAPKNVRGQKKTQTNGR